MFINKTYTIECITHTNNLQNIANDVWVFFGNFKHLQQLNTLPNIKYVNYTLLPAKIAIAAFFTH